MTTSAAIAGIVEAVATVVAAGGEADAAVLTADQLMAVGEAFGLLKRRVDAAFAPVAAEIARQSRPEHGSDSFARKQGFRTPVTLISTTTGSTAGEAIKLVQVGQATAPRLSLTGEVLPAKHPHVAAAFETGTIGTAAASAIISLLDKVVIRAGAIAVEEMEQRLVAAAPGLSLDQLSRLLVRAEAHLDPDGVVPREDAARASRSLTIQERDGMLLLTGRFDGETGAPIKAAIDGIVTATLRRNQHDSAPAADDRSVRQIQADALADLCRHGLGCDQVPTRPVATIVVRMNLADLESGVGTGTIDGIDQPVSASVVRRMAADAQFIPCVLGSDSEILDWGRARRLFTPAQKLALAERDGGCAHCGAPPHMTIGHHVRWWYRDAGPTDLANGILLCVSCHTRLHADGWDIRIDGPGTTAKVWFIPPPWLDPDQTPRLGGRARYDLAS